ncbi:MAG: hypothetical protein WCG05_01625 [Alphaproteobacteria bacterium]
MKFFFLSILLIGLTSCKNPPIKDVTTTHTRTEIGDFLTEKTSIPEKESSSTENKNTMSPAISPIFNKRVSLRIDDTMDVKEILKKLATQAKISLVLNKNVEGSVNYQVEKQPFLKVIETICHMANLRYKVDHEILWIERDLPYLKTYNAQFLSLERNTENQVSINSNIFGKTDSDQSLANGSSSIISSKNNIDFWAELENSLANILQISSSQTTFDEEQEIHEEKKILSDDLLPQEKVNRVRTVEKKKKIAYKKPSFSIHKQAGIVTVFATEKQHKIIQDFMANLRKKTSTQILIEAKVVEVHLNEEYKSGIDWQRIGHYGIGAYSSSGPHNGFTGDLNATSMLGTMAQKRSALVSNPETSQVISLGLSGPSLSAMLNFMEAFGTVRTLSSPRLTVLNNQTAILKVAENYIFFDITADRQFLNSSNINYGTLVSATSKPRSIPIGLVMAVQPSIDEESDEVILTLRPTISRLIATKEDPAVQLLNQSLPTPSANLKSEFPVVAVREIDSVLRIKSGGIAVLGGLMTEGAETGSAGIPGTADSAVSFLTTSKRQARVVSELVIFIRATILSESRPDAADFRLYDRFTKDPRPLENKPA